MEGTPSDHPLITELAPIFSELYACTNAEDVPEITLSSSVSKLEHVIEEEKDALSYRNNMRAMGTNGKYLATWINQQIKELFDTEATMKAGIRFIQAFMTVEYMDASELTRIFSQLLLAAIVRSRHVAVASEAAVLWGTMLHSRASPMEEIAKGALKALLAVLLANQSSMGDTKSSAHKSHDLRQAAENLLRLGADTALSEKMIVKRGKLSACVLLHQIVQFAPTVAAPYVEEILQKCLRPVVGDEDLQIRRAGSEALRQTLRLAYKSAGTSYHAYQDLLLEDVVKGTSQSVETCDVVRLEGSLLTFYAVMASLPTEQHSAAAPTPSSGAAESTSTDLSSKSKGYVRDISLRISEELLSCNGVPPSVRETLFTCLPLLAVYDRRMFMEIIAVRVKDICQVAFTQKVWRSAREVPISSGGEESETNIFAKEDQRSALLLLLTELTTAIPEFVFSFLDPLMGYIETSLERHGERDRCGEAATCFATLAEKEPKLVRPFLRGVMGPLFSGPITTELARDVAKICAAFPGLRSTCLSKVLSSAKDLLRDLPRRLLTADNSADQTQYILKIFEALDSLDFTGYSTLHFLCESVLPFVTDLHEDVRRSAIHLCFKLVHSGCVNSPCQKLERGVLVHCGKEHTHLVCKVVERLCHAAVADANSDIRLQTLQKFTREFDHSLALLDCNLLTPALFDKFHNVVASAHLLGRISTLNPVGTYPALRRVVMQCLSDIKYFKNSKPHEQSITLIAIIAESAPRLIQPYLPSLLRSCATRLKDTSQPSTVVTALLSCAGKLARYAEGADIDVVREIQPTVVEHILDSSSPLKKHEAIRTLCDVIRTTKDVNIFEKHESYQRLLGALMGSLHGGLKERLVVRLDTLKLMGIIGAMDPHRVKRITRHLRDAGAGYSSSSGIAALDKDNSMYPQHVIHHILEVLKLPSLTADQCVCAVEVVTDILSLKDLAPELVGYHPRIIEAILTHTTQYEEERGRLLSLLTTAVLVMKHYIRPFVRRIVKEILTYLPAHGESLQKILQLLLSLWKTLGEELRPFLRDVLPHLIHNVQMDLSNALPVFRFYSKICVLLDTSMHTLLPNVCEVAGNKGAPLPCREEAVRTLCSFGRQFPAFALEAPRCVHCLCGVLKEWRDAQLPIIPAPECPPWSGSTEIHSLPRMGQFVVIALTNIAWNLGPQFDKFMAVVRHVLDPFGSEMRNRVMSGIARAAHGEEEPETLPETDTEVWSPRPNEKHHLLLKKPQDEIDRRHSMLPALDRLSQFRGMEDWGQWVHQLSVTLLHHSPSPAHQLAEKLAVKHASFAQRIFHSAFRVMYEHRETKITDLLKALDDVLSSVRVPSEVLQELLNLSEYMERVVMRSIQIQQWTTAQKGLLFNVRTLMDCSQQCHLYAKALHYVELQFYDATLNYQRDLSHGHVRKFSPKEWLALLELCEKSIYLYNLLGHRESAESILQFIEANFFFLTGMKQSSLSQMMDAQLFEKLQWWSESQRAYHFRLQKEPDNVASMAGYMRSLDNLGNYNGLLDGWKKFSVKLHQKDLQVLAPYAAHAAWLLRRWDDMKAITEVMPTDGYIGVTALFYQAVVAVSHRHVHLAQELIQQCRRRLDSQVSTLIAESYDRAYSIFIGIQQLCELEEFLLALSGQRSMAHWQEMWEKRLGAMAYAGWAGTMTNHAIMIPPHQELNMWLKFVTLARLNGHGYISSEILAQLRGHRSIEEAIQETIATEQETLPLQPALALASFQHLYDTDQRLQAMSLLWKYVNGMSGKKVSEDQTGSLALCHSKLVYWLFTHTRQKRLGVGSGASPFAPQVKASLGDTDVTHQILYHLSRATKLDAHNGIIWRTWARIHADLAFSVPSSSEQAMQRSHHVAMAVDGYVRSMCLTQELEDTLGFLSLWFTFGDDLEIRRNKGVEEAMLRVPTTVWLKVNPQIIARLQSDREYIAESVFRLLAHVGEEHPQALLYALSVANASYHLSTVETLLPQAAPQTATEKLGAAERLLQTIGEFHRNGSTLVADAALVCEEVVRCAALWPEMWEEALEKVLSCEMNFQENIRVWVLPLMNLLRHPATGWETHFAEEHGPFLEQWFSGLKNIIVLDEKTRRKVSEETQNLFHRIRQTRMQISKLSVLSLSTVSPALATRGRSLSLVVPGQYREDGPYPSIQFFEEKLEVMNTKQRPRRMYIHGTDGVRYNFLLKGHGDLRLDERVMQLLSCVNTLLEKHSATQQRDCAIQVYSVTPLSENAGLVGWVDNSDTFHHLILEYRQNSNIRLESTAMVREVNFKKPLLPIQLLEQFENALETTPGTDLANSMWMKAPSAEVWLDRRTTYVCSLATMSMVGHILGLGDRHPSNLMIHAYSGRVIHIDFGECFEAAQLRLEKPENVPFRLTRVLVNALEVGGINGLFRHGCVTVMNILRREGSSILALLEAFVHDPLVSWWGEELEEPPNNEQHRAYSKLVEFYEGNHSSFNSVANIVGSHVLHRQKDSVGQCGVSVVRLCRETGTTLYHRPNQQHLKANKAQRVVDRIREKLEGLEFHDAATSNSPLNVEAQVRRLIEEARSNENLCVHYIGWCPFW